MSYCNHFRDFLVLSSADLTRLTLVDLDLVPGSWVSTENKISVLSSLRVVGRLKSHSPEVSSPRGIQLGPLSLFLAVLGCSKLQNQNTEH